MATSTSRFEYVDATCNEALLDSIDLTLAQDVNEQIRKRQRLSQIDTNNSPARRTFVSDKRHSKLTAELLAERFGISPTWAQLTLRVTTQQVIRSAILPIS
jgi:hypothetical protein